jgi:hypothetical protein
MSKPASSLSELRLIPGQFNRTPTHSARRADGRCDACQGAAEGPGLVQFGRRFAISMGSHLSSRPIATCWKPQQLSIHLQKILLVRCLSVLPSAVILPRPPSEQKSHAAPFLCSSMLAVVGAPRTPSYDFTCKAFIDGCSHSPSRLAVSRVADSVPKFVQARLLCCFGS